MCLIPSDTVRQDAREAASLEFQNVCDRFDLNNTQRFELMADMMARTCLDAVTRIPGWRTQCRAIHQAIEDESRRRLRILMEMVR